MTEALLFDYNGVITDDEEQHRATFAELLAEAGIALTRDQYYADYLGCDDRTSFVHAFRRAGKPLDPGALETLVARKSQAYARLTGTAPAAAGLVWTSFAGHDPAELAALGDA